MGEELKLCLASDLLEYLGNTFGEIRKIGSSDVMGKFKIH